MEGKNEFCNVNFEHDTFAKDEGLVTHAQHPSSGTTPYKLPSICEDKLKILEIKYREYLER